MKVMTIKNYETKEELARVQVKNVDDLFRITLTPDMLGLPEDCTIVRTGITCYSTKGLIMSNDPEVIAASDEVHTGANSAIIGPRASKNIHYDAEPVRVLYPGDGEVKELNLKLAITVYPEGYIINAGKTSYNIFGRPQEMYFSSIGKKHFKCTSAQGARVFKDLNSLIKYMENNKDVFHYMVTENSYNFSVEPACELFASSMYEIPEKDKKHVERLSDLLDVINTLPETEDDEEVLEGEASQEEITNEAIRRLIRLGVMDTVIEKFKNGELFMSEFGGILYDLNEDAKIAVSVVKDRGDIPYAVCRSQTEIGDLYAVLFVSPDKNGWDFERPDREGNCFAYTYNASCPVFSEFGEIQITSANGGLVRTA